MNFSIDRRYPFVDGPDWSHERSIDRAGCSLACAIIGEAAGPCRTMHTYELLVRFPELLSRHLDSPLVRYAVVGWLVKPYLVGGRVVVEVQPAFFVLAVHSMTIGLHALEPRQGVSYKNICS